MTQETKELQTKIDQQKAPETSGGASVAGFGVALAIMTDMVCCLLVGIGLGLLIQRLFHTSPVVIAVFGLLGGIAGLFSVVQMGMHRGQK